MERIADIVIVLLGCLASLGIWGLAAPTVEALPSAETVALTLTAIAMAALFETFRAERRAAIPTLFCLGIAFFEAGPAFIPIAAYELMGCIRLRAPWNFGIAAVPTSLVIVLALRPETVTDAPLFALSVAAMTSFALLLSARTNTLLAQRSLNRRIRDDMQERTIALRGENTQLTDVIQELQAELPRRTDSAMDGGRPAAFTCLTEREYEVARLVADGLDNHEIAATAYISEGTVRNRISSILAKMGLKNRTQIAVTWWRGR